MYDIDIRDSAIGCWIIVKDGIYDPGNRLGNSLADKSLKIHLKSPAHLQTMIALLQEIDNLEIEVNERFTHE